ncbi:MAG: TetR/AcrR family transcriptional regulator [Beutenbergiaceae bacterium]
MGSDTRPINLVAVRAELRASTDPRAERTRARLFAAATVLCSDDTTITVSALTNAAGVSRAAFYTHFTDLGDLAMHMAQAQFDQIGSVTGTEYGTDPAAAMRHGTRDLVSHFSANRALYRAVLVLPAEGGGNQIARIMSAPTRRLVDVVGSIPAGLRPDIAADYLAGATANVMTAWILDELRADENELCEHLFQLLPLWMRGG